MNDFLTRLRDAHLAGVFPPGQVTHVNVEHADGCPMGHDLSRRCHCHPLITATVNDEVLVIGSGGAILERIKLV